MANQVLRAYIVEVPVYYYMKSYVLYFPLAHPMQLKHAHRGIFAQGITELCTRIKFLAFEVLIRSSASK